ncbi:MAG: DNA/RNA nuclease SfsA [Spartobacteria bacterium]|nr:DNA/RNA nuclease SfsA [Spartobacteria bacterium]
MDRLFTSLTVKDWVQGHLVKRKNRFVATVQLDSGALEDVYCPNTGAMTGFLDEGVPVMLSRANSASRKYPNTWEWAGLPSGWVGINTLRANGLVEEIIRKHWCEQLSDLVVVQAEKSVSEGSRFDFLCRDDVQGRDCLVEVKSVTLSDGAGGARFPDAVTARGAKHVNLLADYAKKGWRCVVVYLIQRDDCHTFKVADTIDPIYAASIRNARLAGVETVACAVCPVPEQGIYFSRTVPDGDINHVTGEL